MRAIIAGLAGLVAIAALAGATPLVCADPCTIDSNGSGYFLPVTEIASGTSVVWTTQDTTHIQGETVLLGAGDLCIAVSAQPAAPSPPVRFDLAAGVLTATSEDVTLPCTNAIVTDSGAVLLYHCLLHPTMRGALVVTA